MALSNTTRQRFLAAFVVILVVAALGFVLLAPDWRLGEVFLNNSYDSLHLLSGIHSSATADSPVVIVYLDVPSFQQEKQDPTRPWPRELHAQLVQRLTAAGARAVIFDIVFTGAGLNPVADEAFAQAVHENGHVVLAAEQNNSTIERSDSRSWVRIGTVEQIYQPFATNAAASGLATFSIDDDNLVRRYVAGFPQESLPSLSWATAEFLNMPVTQNPTAMDTANKNWVRYYGPALTIPHISYSQALHSTAEDNNFFRDKIVFIGGRSAIGQFNERTDEFGNPFHSWRYRSFSMAGVEVHATEMLNLVRNDALRRLSDAKERIILLCVALVFGGGLVWMRPIPAALASLAGIVVVLLLSRAAFAQGIWFPWLIASAAQIPSALGLSVLYYSVDWYRARLRFEASRREAEAKIREQAALIDKANDAILVQDLSGRIAYANTSAEKLYGWKQSELQSNGTSEELFAPDAAAASAARASALTQGEWTGELRQQTRSGQIVTVASRWTLIRDQAGQPKELLLINTDVTEKKQLEAQFLRTQRMNTIGTLAGGMAHDLNNALAPILMGAQLLRRRTTDSEMHRLLELMETQTHRSADMVRQVLLFARGRGGEFEQLELGPLLKELEKMVRETFPINIEIETFLPGDLWAVRGNPTQLHQVLLNLCVNARDAMPKGGRLSFAADNVELNPEQATKIPDARPGEFISLLVSDTGTGMPPEIVARIFEPFFTTKGEGRGTGIGLSTVSRIVKSHGGFLAVESEPGQGTTFEIFLPRELQSSPAASSVQAPSAVRGNGELILVVDDEIAVRDLVAQGLELHGYRALSAADGANAVQVFGKNIKQVRLVITDFAMPVMDGLQLIETLRRRQPTLPAILVSAEEQSQPNGIRILRKPFSLEEVINAVNQSLKAHL
jgi:PAS domain S-box-containing protein